jgi:hypothetical protein
MQKAVLPVFKQQLYYFASLQIMRKVLTNVLMVLFCWSVVMPAEIDGPKPDPHACCRRGGAHHCDEQQTQNPDRNELRARCPHHSVSLSTGTVSLSQPAQRTAQIAASSFVVQVQPSVAGLARLVDHTKRGPPAVSPA